MQNGLSSVRFWSKALQRPILVKSFTAQVEGAVHLAYCVHDLEELLFAVLPVQAASL